MSNIVGCLAVTTDFTAYDPRRILYHCTYLDLKFPIVAELLCDMVLTQEGANVGQVQHLQITCLQKQLNNDQLVVQQFHIQSRAVYPISPRHVADEGEYDENNEGGAATCFPTSVESDMMNLMEDMSIQNEQPAAPLPPYPSSATGGKAGISIISSNPDDCPPGSFPDFAFVGNKAASQIAPPLPAESVDIGVKSKGILLNALKIRPSDSQSSNLANTVSSKESTNVKLVNDSQVRSNPSPGSMAINHSESSSSFELVNKKAETPQSNEQPQQNIGSVSLSSKIRKIPFDLGKLMGSSTSDQSNVTKKETILTDNQKEEDEWEKASMTISRSFVGNDFKDSSTSQSAQLSLSAPNNLSDRELLKSLAEQVAAMQTTLQTLVNEKKNQPKKSSSEITQKQINELKSGISQEVTKSVGNLVLGAVQEHSAEAVAKILGSEQWREEVLFYRFLRLFY